MTNANPFGGMTYNAAEAKDTDTLGGGFKRLDSAVYPFTIKLAYLTYATSGAMAFNLEAVTDAGVTMKETQYISNKEGSNQYPDKKTGEKKYMPSFLTINSLALLTTGQPLTAQRAEKKHINLYNYDKKAEVPTEVIMLTEMIGKKFLGGVIKRREDKQTKNPQTGVYENTGDDREINVLDKVFRATDKLTESEILAKATEPKFLEAWKAKWDGQVDDRFKGKQGQGNAGAPAGNFAGGGDGAGASTPPADNPFM